MIIVVPIFLTENDTKFYLGVKTIIVSRAAGLVKIKPL